MEKEYLNQLLVDLNRSTPKDKVVGIVNFSNNVSLVMEHRAELSQKFNKIGLNLNLNKYMDILSLLLSVLINILIVAFFELELTDDSIILYNE